GEVLMDHHLNHDNLKNDFKVQRFGARCKILSSIKLLERQCSVSSTSPTTGLGVSISPLEGDGANIGRFQTEAGSTAQGTVSQHSVHFKPEDEDIEIRLLETPLTLLRNSDSIDESGVDSDESMRSSMSYDSSSDDIPLSTLRKRNARGLSVSTKSSTHKSKRRASVAAPHRQGFPTRIDSAPKSTSPPAHVTTDDVIDMPLASPISDSRPADLPSPTITPTTATTISPSREPGARRKSSVRMQTEQYLGPRGVPLEEFILDVHSGPPSDDEIKEWTVYMGRSFISGQKQHTQLLQPHLMRPGYRDIVQRNIRRILRQTPVYDAPGGTGEFVYAPIRRQAKNVPVKLFKATPTGEHVVERSTWDEVFARTQDKMASGSIRSDVTLKQDGSTIEIQFGEAPKSTARSKNQDSWSNSPTTDKHALGWLRPDEEDVILPLYGESDTDDYTTDEELLREIAQEEKEKLDKLNASSQRADKPRSSTMSKRLATTEIAAILEDYIKTRKERWATKRRPELEHRAYRIYSKKDQLQEDVRKELEYLQATRLADCRQAITHSEYLSKREVERACGALDNTIDLICELQWKTDLFKGPEPAKPAKTTEAARRPKEPKQTVDGEAENIQISDEASVTKTKETTEATDRDVAEEDITMASEGDDEESSFADEDEDDLEGFIVDDTDEEEMMRKEDSVESKEEHSKRAKARARDRYLKRNEKRKQARISKISSRSPDDVHPHVLKPSPKASAVDDTTSANATEATTSSTTATITATSSVSAVAEESTEKVRSTPQSLSPSPPPTLLQSADTGSVHKPKAIQETNKEDSQTPSERTRKFSNRVSEIESLQDGIYEEGPNDVQDERPALPAFDENNDRSPQDQRETPPPRSEKVERHLFGHKSQKSQEVRGMDALSRKINLHPNWLDRYPDDDALIAALSSVRRNNNIGIMTDNEAFDIYLEYIDWKTFALDDYDDDFKGFLQWKRAGMTRDDLLKDLREKQEEEQRQREAELARERAERKEREEQAKRQRQQEELARKQAERQRTLEQAKAAAENAITIGSDSDTDEDSSKEPRSKVRHSPVPQIPRSARTARRGGKGDQRGDQRNLSALKKQSDRSSGTTSNQEDADIPSITPAKRSKPDGSGHQRRDSKAANARDELVEDVSSTNEVSDTDQTEDLERPRRKMLKVVPRSRILRKSHIEREVIEPAEVLRLREEATKSQKALEERIKAQRLQIAEQQRLRIAGDSEVIDMDNLVNAGFKTHERPIYFPPWMAKLLKPHQKEGVRFMWRNVVMMEGGCILAHSMGLGKTFQVVSVVYLLLSELRKGNPDIPKVYTEGSALIVCPATITQNWLDEFRKWIPAEDQDHFRVFTIGKDVKVAERIMMLQKWRSEGGVFILGNEMFRDMASPREGTTCSQPEIKELLAELLLNPGPSIMILDEGHSLKNAQAKLSVVSKQIKTLGRIILTGYPLQNRLEEYWNMVDFIRPNYLGDLRMFKSNYVLPITRGLFPDSTIGERKFASKRLMVLTNLIKDFVQRKDSSVLVATLPKKVEYVVVCGLTSLQRTLYLQYLEQIKDTDNGLKGVLGLGQILLTICNHPAIFKNCISREKGKATISSAAQSVSTTPATPSTPTSVGSPTTAVGPTLYSTPNQGSTSADPLALESDEEVERQVAEVVSSNEFKFNWDSIPDLEKVTHSYKMSILADLLTFCRMLGEKTLVFSRSIPTLDYIERHICQAQHIGYKRIDGEVPVQYRPGRVHEFNYNPNIDVFLISTGSGSQGINLFSASRVIIVDVGWNPSVDEQAVARAFRYGQSKPVYVYRLQTHGTWEDKLHKTNIHKLGLSKRVIDEKNTVRNFNKNQMKKYFEPPPETTPKWAASEERVENLFEKHPEVDEDVIREIIERYKDSLTLVIPQSQFTLEEKAFRSHSTNAPSPNPKTQESTAAPSLPAPTTGATPSKGPNGTATGPPSLTAEVDNNSSTAAPAEPLSSPVSVASLLNPQSPEPTLEELHQKAPVFRPAMWLSNANPKAKNIGLVMERIKTLSPAQASRLSVVLGPHVFAEQPDISWAEAKQMTHGTIDIRTLPQSSKQAAKFLGGGHVLYEHVHETGLRRATIIILNPYRKDLHHVLPPQPSKKDSDNEEDEKDVEVLEPKGNNKDDKEDGPEQAASTTTVDNGALKSSSNNDKSMATTGRRPGRPRLADNSKIRLPYQFTPAELLMNLDKHYGDIFTAKLTAIQWASDAFVFVFVNLTPAQADEPEPQHQYRQRPTISHPQPQIYDLTNL
ncbi:hypothetical protein BGW41_001038, partial [Actinomortierella wolfii]